MLLSVLKTFKAEEPHREGRDGRSKGANMSTGDEKIVANQLNAKKSTGPRNTTSTRFNATKHGLLAAGVTELDDAEGYRATLRDLKQEKDPVGATEVFLVESAALDMTRWRRARRLEAEYITVLSRFR